MCDLTSLGLGLANFDLTAAATIDAYKIAEHHNTLVSNYLSGGSFHQTGGAEEISFLFCFSWSWTIPQLVWSRGLPDIGRRTLPGLAVKAQGYIAV